MAVTIEKVDEQKPNDADYSAFTVQIGEKRILTVYTCSESVMSKWVSDVKKAYQNKKQPLIVGFCADRNLNYTKKGVEDNPYDILTLCTGSHCLIYDLPDNVSGCRGYSLVPETLKALFSDRNTIFVGLDIPCVLEKLEKDQELKAARKVDIRAIARQISRKGNRNIRFYSLDKAAKLLLGMEIDDGERKVIERWCLWRDWDDSSLTINREYVKNLTIDAFFCHQIGFKYADVAYQLSRNKHGFYF